LLFGLVAAAWLRFELKKNFSLLDHIGWLAAAMTFGLLGSVIYTLNDNMAGNFLLHAIGGGMASVCLYLYLARSTGGPKLHWRLELIALFMFVCTLGVLNELAEYAAELTTDVIMSIDTHDTWRDFVANTSGALLLWAILGTQRWLRTGKV
jgi:hypothetical protein